jgi:magnesium chelatase family protein
LLDRIDLHVNVPSINYDELKNKNVQSKSSAQMYEEVKVAVQVQEKRLGSVRNADMASDQVEKYCVLSAAAEQAMKFAFEKLSLSMRGYHKILKIARTIADLQSADMIEKSHIQEAIGYRSLDQKLQ